MLIVNCIVGRVMPLSDANWFLKQVSKKKKEKKMNVDPNSSSVKLLLKSFHWISLTRIEESIKFS